MPLHPTVEVLHYPIGSIVWMADMHRVVQVRVETITVYLEAERSRAEHVVRPVDLPPEVQTYMADIRWQRPEIALLFETEEDAQKAMRTRFAERGRSLDGGKDVIAL